MRRTADRPMGVRLPPSPSPRSPSPKRMNGRSSPVSTIKLKSVLKPIDHSTTNSNNLNAINMPFNEPKKPGSPVQKNITSIENISSITRKSTTSSTSSLDSINSFGRALANLNPIPTQSTIKEANLKLKENSPLKKSSASSLRSKRSTNSQVSTLSAKFEASNTESSPSSGRSSPVSSKYKGNPSAQSQSPDRSPASSYSWVSSGISTASSRSPENTLTSPHLETEISTDLKTGRSPSPQLYNATKPIDSYKNVESLSSPPSPRIIRHQASKSEFTESRIAESRKKFESPNDMSNRPPSPSRTRSTSPRRPESTLNLPENIRQPAWLRDREKSKPTTSRPASPIRSASPVHRSTSPVSITPIDSGPKSKQVLNNVASYTTFDTNDILNTVDIDPYTGFKSDKLVDNPYKQKPGRTSPIRDYQAAKGVFEEKVRPPLPEIPITRQKTISIGYSEGWYDGLGVITNPRTPSPNHGIDRHPSASPARKSPKRKVPSSSPKISRSPITDVDTGRSELNRATSIISVQSTFNINDESESDVDRILTYSSFTQNKEGLNKVISKNSILDLKSSLNITVDDKDDKTLEQKVSNSSKLDSLILKTEDNETIPLTPRFSKRFSMFDTPADHQNLEDEAENIESGSSRSSSHSFVSDLDSSHNSRASVSTTISTISTASNKSANSITSINTVSSAASAIAKGLQASPKLGKTPSLPPPSPTFSMFSTATATTTDLESLYSAKTSSSTYYDASGNSRNNSTTSSITRDRSIKSTRKPIIEEKEPISTKNSPKVLKSSVKSNNNKTAQFNKKSPRIADNASEVLEEDFIDLKNTPYYLEINQMPIKRGGIWGIVEKDEIEMTTFDKLIRDDLLCDIFTCYMLLVVVFA